MTKVSNADRRLPMEERAHVVDDGRLAIPGFRRGSVGYGCNRPPSAVPTLRSDLATGAGDDVPPLPSPPPFPNSPAMNAPHRSEECRVGKQCVSTLRSRWSQY